MKCKHDAKRTVVCYCNCGKYCVGGNQLLLQTVKFGKHKTSAVVDSGATINLISLDCVRKWKIPLESSDSTIQPITGNTKSSHGRVNISVEIQGKSFGFNGECIESSQDMVLGLPFLKANKMQINFGGDTTHLSYSTGTGEGANLVKTLAEIREANDKISAELSDNSNCDSNEESDSESSNSRSDSDKENQGELTNNKARVNMGKCKHFEMLNNINIENGDTKSSFGKRGNKNKTNGDFKNKYKRGVGQTEILNKNLLNSTITLSGNKVKPKVSPGYQDTSLKKVARFDFNNSGKYSSGNLENQSTYINDNRILALNKNSSNKPNDFSKGSAYRNANEIITKRAIPWINPKNVACKSKIIEVADENSNKAVCNAAVGATDERLEYLKFVIDESRRTIWDFGDKDEIGDRFDPRFPEIELSEGEEIITEVNSETENSDVRELRDR